MTLNGVMAVILRYFIEFVYDVVTKLTFAGSSFAEFLVYFISTLQNQLQSAATFFCNFLEVPVAYTPHRAVPADFKPCW